MIPHREQFHPQAVTLFDRCWDALVAAELDPVFVYGWRDPKAQAALWAQGRTKPGAIVTWARPGQSPHNATLAGGPASLAFDVCPRALIRVPDWQPKHAYWGVIGEIVATIAGLEWGGNFQPAKKADRPHIQAANWRQFPNEALGG